MRDHMSKQERRELWRERISAFYDSGLSAAQFCAEHALNLTSSGTGLGAFGMKRRMASFRPLSRL
ncbi:hypothetical protein Alches_27980 [Alicyclobacillus hesperidum subsp. aegles]|uniref:IS66 family insertion sequence element accessory protein TnpA n=1 Tax=Alicyclobacillus hesperidum TaxID=89784 RepID=UPI00222CD728|nr:hypothetical protein [Alicyclobacillus hesperidum]GLG02757.1 hypothetical protein Alches_27980 [Alicyclobacillus hesperidum subsp. aegles]